MCNRKKNTKITMYFDKFLVCFFVLISMNEQAVEGDSLSRVGLTGLLEQSKERYTRDAPGEDDGELAEIVQRVSERLQVLESAEELTRKVIQCSVGMKLGGSIENGQITASSIWDNNHAAYHGRLDNERSTKTRGVWVPSSSRVTAGEWLQVDLLAPRLVTGVVTQGRSDEDQWITRYTIQYRSVTSESWQTIKNHDGHLELFTGNNDNTNYVLNNFPSPVTARYFRLVVQEFNAYPSVRMDYVTC